MNLLVHNHKVPGLPKRRFPSIRLPLRAPSRMKMTNFGNGTVTLPRIADSNNSWIGNQSNYSIRKSKSDNVVSSPIRTIRDEVNGPHNRRLNRRKSSLCLKNEHRTEDDFSFFGSTRPPRAMWKNLSNAKNDNEQLRSQLHSNLEIRAHSVQSPDGQQQTSISIETTKAIKQHGSKRRKYRNGKDHGKKGEGAEAGKEHGREKGYKEKVLSRVGSLTSKKELSRPSQLEANSTLETPYPTERRRSSIGISIETTLCSSNNFRIS